jgi:hypothetical protein
VGVVTAPVGERVLEVSSSRLVLGFDTPTELYDNEMIPPLGEIREKAGK